MMNYSLELSESAVSLPAVRRQILLTLRKLGEADLEVLSKTLGITKMGTLKHVVQLEEKGLIERFHKKLGVGRPRLVLKLSPEAIGIFPKAYGRITCFALEYIQKKLGDKAVEEVLWQRQQQVLKDYGPKLKGKAFDDQVSELAKLRDSEGYMAELQKTGAGNYELLEYNCPILDVAQTFGEACTTEQRMFEQLLGTEIETTHRVVAGANVCRFFIKKPGN